MGRLTAQTQGNDVALRLGPFPYAAGPKTFRQQRVSALIPKLYKDKRHKQEEKKNFLQGKYYLN